MKYGDIFNVWAKLCWADGGCFSALSSRRVTTQESSAGVGGWGNVIRPTRCPDQGTSYRFTNLLLPHRGGGHWGGVCSAKLNELLIRGETPANRPLFDQAWTLLQPPAEASHSKDPHLRGLAWVDVNYRMNTLSF